MPGNIHTNFHKNPAIFEKLDGGLSSTPPHTLGWGSVSRRMFSAAYWLQLMSYMFEIRCTNVYLYLKWLETYESSVLNSQRRHSKPPLSGVLRSFIATFSEGTLMFGYLKFTFDLKNSKLNSILYSPFRSLIIKQLTTIDTCDLGGKVEPFRQKTLNLLLII